MNATTTRAVLLYGLSGLLLILPLVASTGFFIVDEVLYFLSVHAFHSGDGLLVDNGSRVFSSGDLSMLNLLVRTDNGFAPQYPAGFAIVGSLFFEIFGARGLILINALAAIGALFVTHLLALRLFQSMAVANLSVALFAIFSFMPEYAAGYWPHMVSILSVTSSLYLLLRAIDYEAPFWWAAGSGLVLGGGLLFRLDGVFLLSTIALLTVLYAKNPLLVFAGGLVGMLPGLAFLSATNAIKFGRLNPISYGTNDGAASYPKTYIIFAVVAGVATLAVWAVRSRGGLPKPWGVVLAVIAVVAILILPQTEKLVQLLVRGTSALFIDSTSIVDVRSGVQLQSDGTLSFWGLSKKALGQSLPWLGVLAALLILPKTDHRRSISIILIFSILWSLPFVLRIWHGGLGSNMRYLLPILPALSALAAWIMLQIADRLENPVRTITIGAVIAFGMVQGWLLLAESGGPGVQQILSTYVLIAVAALVCIGLLIEKLRPASGVAVGLGLAMALMNSFSDQLAGQARRALTHDIAMDFAQITDPVVIYGAPEISVFAPAKTKALSAFVPFTKASFDKVFVAEALAADYRVIMPDTMLGMLGKTFEVLKPTPDDVPEQFSEIVATR